MGFLLPEDDESHDKGVGTCNKPRWRIHAGALWLDDRIV